MLLSENKTKSSKPLRDAQNARLVLKFLFKLHIDKEFEQEIYKMFQANTFSAKEKEQKVICPFSHPV